VDDRHVRRRVGSHDLRVGLASVGEGDLDRVGVRDDVLVGDDVAVLVEDEAAALALALPAAGNPERSAAAARGRRRYLDDTLWYVRLGVSCRPWKTGEVRNP
jgi:hypothetical protein